MSSEDFSDLPILKSFKGLERGDNVFSRKYGVGQVYSLYDKDQIIVKFSNLRKRIALDERDISKIPDSYAKKQRSKIEVRLNGKRVNFKEYKRRRKIEKQIKKYKELTQKNGKVISKGKSDQFLFPF